MASSNPVVEARSLYRSYRSGATPVSALRDVSLLVHEGEFVAILGPSGSGKSTLLHVLGCLDRPTSGRVFLLGTDATAMGDAGRTALRLRDIGFVFQASNLLPTLSALENVEFQLRLQGVGRRERSTRARTILEGVGLASRLDHRPSELSGGEQQRVAIARALVKGPALLLADEPTGNLDSATGAAVIDLLAAFSRSGQTIVLATHDLELAGKASRVLTLRDGGLATEPVASGTN